MMNRLTDTVKHLIIINVIMFIGTLTVGGGKLFYEWFSLYFPESNTFKPWQIFTHMFMHGDLGHIFFNMFALFMFGVAVEQYLGNKNFLFLYISAGLGAVLFQLGYIYFDYYPLLNNISNIGFSSDFIDAAINLDILDVNEQGKRFFNGDIFQDKLPSLLSEYSVNSNLIDGKVLNDLYEMNVITHNNRMVGASGCIMGILVAFGMMNPNAELMLIFLPIPIKAKYFIPGIIILDLISAISGRSFFSPSNTAYMAHIGGAVTGFLIMWYWRKTQFNKNRWN